MTLDEQIHVFVKAIESGGFDKECSDWWNARTVNENMNILLDIHTRLEQLCGETLTTYVTAHLLTEQVNHAFWVRCLKLARETPGKFKHT